MIASKTIFSSTDPSNLHLPAVTVSKKPQRRLRRSPNSSMVSVPPSAVSTNVSENVSALKAKYADYATWLKASSRQNREPVFTHELLKHSLCQMGIDSTQATQLVSTCTWYVYQFQKGLGVETEQRDQSPPATTTETKKSQQSSKKQHKNKNMTKSKKINSSREDSPESETTLASPSKENLLSHASRSHTRSRFSVLPSIHTSEPSVSPRSRRVDFDNEQSTSQPIGKQKSSHWRSATSKARVLPKLRSMETDSAVSVNDQSDIMPENAPIEPELSTAQRHLPQNSLITGQTRSILRKQTSITSSLVSTDVGSRRYRHRLLTPASTFIDEIPLGTKSQRLFGGSECFAQIMNELEEQNLH